MEYVNKWFPRKSYDFVFNLLFEIVECAERAKVAIA